MLPNHIRAVQRLPVTPYITRILKSPWQVGQVTRLVNKQVYEIVVQPKRSSAHQQVSS